MRRDSLSGFVWIGCSFKKPWRTLHCPLSLLRQFRHYLPSRKVAKEEVFTDRRGGWCHVIGGGLICEKRSTNVLNPTKCLFSALPCEAVLDVVNVGSGRPIMTEWGNDFHSL